MTPKDWGIVTCYRGADSGYKECEIDDPACVHARVMIDVFVFHFNLSPLETTRATNMGELKKLIAALDTAVNIGREQVKTEIRRVLNADSE